MSIWSVFFLFRIEVTGSEEMKDEKRLARHEGATHLEKLARLLSGLAAAGEDNNIASEVMQNDNGSISSAMQGFVWFTTGVRQTVQGAGSENENRRAMNNAWSRYTDYKESQAFRRPLAARS